MKKILVIGAGLSSSYLINYLLTQASMNNWQVTVADSNQETAERKIHGSSVGRAISLDANNPEEINNAVLMHDIVLSMLPAFMHVEVAKACITHRKHLVTASYVSNEMQALNEAASDAGIIMLNECGLDPGIDHLSAMRLIDSIKKEGGTVNVFKSFCGGLIAPEYDDNPWNYKFTWNPRNVVLAGQATAKYLEHNELKFIPPQRIFTQTEAVHVEGYGDFESYANRDSLGYIIPYGIEQAHTVLRGTLRKKGYSEAWNCLVKLGLTDDSFIIHHSDSLTYRSWLSALTPGEGLDKLEQRVCDFLQINEKGELFKKLEWLGLFTEEPIVLKEASPATILQYLLQIKWKLQKGELDMIVMHHELEATIENKKQRIISSLVVEGEDEVLTAMAKTVGLPMAIACKLILQDRIQSRGVCIPLAAEFYEPILAELEAYGVKFNESFQAL